MRSAASYQIFVGLFLWKKTSSCNRKKNVKKKRPGICKMQEIQGSVGGYSVKSFIKP